MKGRKNLTYLIFIKNINIPPHVSLIVGILLIIVRIILNAQGVVPQFIQLFGVILVVIGIAGLLGKLSRKKQP